MVSLVSSRVKGGFWVIPRDRNIGHFDFALSDDRHHRSMDCSFHWKPNCLIRLWHESVLARQLIFEAICCTIHPYKVGAVDRFSGWRVFRLTGFPVDGSSCAAVLVWWFEERCLLAAVPLPPLLPVIPGILLSIHSSFNVSIFAQNGSCLWLRK